MPEYFPTRDPKTGELVDTEYFTLDEIAAKLHVSAPTARKLIAENHWPHLVIVRRIYMSAADIGDALDMLRVGPIPESTEPPALGWAIPPDPWAKPDEDDREEGFR